MIDYIVPYLDKLIFKKIKKERLQKEHKND